MFFGAFGETFGETFFEAFFETFLLSRTTGGAFLPYNEALEVSTLGSSKKPVS